MGSSAITATTAIAPTRTTKVTTGTSLERRDFPMALVDRDADCPEGIINGPWRTV